MKVSEGRKKKKISKQAKLNQELQSINRLLGETGKKKRQREDEGEQYVCVGCVLTLQLIQNVRKSSKRQKT